MRVYVHARRRPDGEWSRLPSPDEVVAVNFGAGLVSGCWREAWAAFSTGMSLLPGGTMGRDPLFCLALRVDGKAAGPPLPINLAAAAASGQGKRPVDAAKNIVRGFLDGVAPESRLVPVSEARLRRRDFGRNGAGATSRPYVTWPASSVTAGYSSAKVYV